MDGNRSRTRQTQQRYNEYLTNLVFSVRTLSYGSSFFPQRFYMARALRAWAINRRGKNSVRNLRYRPRIGFVRGIYYVSNFADLRMEVPRYRFMSYVMRSFFLSVFSSGEFSGKITSIRSKLPIAACWSREEKRGNCEANLLYVESDFGTTDKSIAVFFTR